jgi:hypothetical protein
VSGFTVPLPDLQVHFLGFFRIHAVSQPESEEYRDFHEHLRSVVGVRDE